MAESPSTRPKKVIDIQNGEVVQVGENNKTNNIFHNCIINNYYNQLPPPTADTVPPRGHTTKPYLRQVQGKVQKKAKNNCRSATAQGRPRDQGPASHAMKISTQTVVDSRGSVLEPGDSVVTGSIGNYNFGIFVGDGMVVTVDKKTRQVVKVPLDVKEPFRKCSSIFSLKYNSVERVRRATRRVGQVFGGDDFDFACWCYTGKKESASLGRFLSVIHRFNSYDGRPRF